MDKMENLVMDKSPAQQAGGKKKRRGGGAKKRKVAEPPAQGPGITSKSSSSSIPAIASEITTGEAPAKKQKVAEPSVADGGGAPQPAAPAEGQSRKEKRKSKRMQRNAKIEAKGAAVDGGSKAGQTNGENGQTKAGETTPAAVAVHKPTGLYGEVTNKGWEDVKPALSAGVMDIITNKLGFNRMTPVQAGTIPLFLSYKDVCVEVTPRPWRV
jgi:hypothetical protein